MTNTNNDKPPVIALREVWKSYGDHVVHRGISLAVARGELITLLGGSGQGKSVLLRLMIGLEKPDRGEIQINGVNVVPLSERQLVSVRKGVGMLFQGSALFDYLTVRENIAFPLREHLRLNEAEIDARVEEKLELVDLPGTEHMMPDQLSGGMKKRVGLARALAMEPSVMLYDEPTTGLDPATANRICRLIRRLQDKLRVTAVMVTHDLQATRMITDRVAMLREGAIIAQGTWTEMVHSAVPEVRAFIEEGLPESA